MLRLLSTRLARQMTPAALPGIDGLGRTNTMEMEWNGIERSHHNSHTDHQIHAHTAQGQRARTSPIMSFGGKSRGWMDAFQGSQGVSTRMPSSPV